MRLVLQEHRRDLVHGLQLLEALLDARLALVGGEHLGRREAAVVGQQRVHAVAALVIGDGRLVHGPFDVVAAAGDLAIGRLGSRAATTCLLEGVLLAHHARDLQVSAHAVVVQDLRDLQVDLCGPAQPGAGGGQAPLELGQPLDGRGQVLLPPMGLVQAQQRAPHPDDGVQLGRGQLGLEDVPLVARAVGVSARWADPTPAPRPASRSGSTCGTAHPPGASAA